MDEEEAGEGEGGWAVAEAWEEGQEAAVAEEAEAVVVVGEEP